MASRPALPDLPDTPALSRRSLLRGAGAGLGSVTLAACLGRPDDAANTRRILLVAGAHTHGFGEHEHEAGCRLLAERLERLDGVTAKVAGNGWCEDPAALESLDALIFYGDGDDRFPVTGHEALVDRLAQRGVGLGFLHFALMPPGTGPDDRMLDWIGGHYQPNWSVNPFWHAKIETLPDHPVTRGVAPFTVEDEWYYHMRFRPALRDVFAVLTAVPPDSTREQPHGPHSGNPVVEARRGMAEHLAWVATRPGGGRGFGFTGGHWHWNWAQDDYRKLVLNAVAWLAGMPIPEQGIASPTPSLDELLAPLGEPPARFDPEVVRRRIAAW